LAKAHHSTNRRDFLGAAAGGAAALVLGAGGLGSALAAAKPASSFDPEENEFDFLMPRVKFKGLQTVVDVWNVSPGGDRNLLEELSSVVRCKVDLPAGVRDYEPYYGDDRHFNAVVVLEDLESIRKYPFLFMTSEGYYDLSQLQKANLKRYIDEGGFLLMDDCVAENGPDNFYQSSCKILQEVFGRSAVVTIPKGHEVFHNVYDFAARGLPRVGGVYHDAIGVTVGGRLAVFLSSVDIHCGWVDRGHRWYRPDSRGIGGHEDALRIGVNVIMYVLSH
jgi:hypothetical protein